MNSVEFKLVSRVLSRLEERISYLLTTFKEKQGSSQLRNDFPKVPPEIKSDSLKENKYFLDCSDVQQALSKAIKELKEFGTFKCLIEVLAEYTDIDRHYEQHEKLLLEKEKEIEELRKVLSEESNVETPVQNGSTKENPLENHSKPLNRLSDVENLMNHKIKSRRSYYEDVFKSIKENIKWYEREAQTQYHADVQSISFWLLKFEEHTKDMDLLLRKTFDDWALKERQLAVLNKYRKLNLEKTEKITVEVKTREKVIEDYRKEKLEEKARLMEEAKREFAATTIQAYWKGTMVRKHLGPYKKKKKGKKGKQKKKK